MVEWKKLKDVAVIKNGKDYKKLSRGNIPVYGTGGIMTYVNQFASDKPSVLLPRKGSVDKIYYVEEPFWTVDTIYWTEIDVSKIIPKYLYITLQQYNLKEYAYGGARPSLSQQILYNLEIPIPSLEEQKRIVGILDTFTDSIENLKQQIAQRRKQYEHYRDQLLDLEGKDGVEMKTLGEKCYISDYVSNGSFASLRENVKYKTEPDYAVLIRFADYSSRFDKSKFVYIDEHAYKYLSKSSLHGGEIIMSNVGSCGLLFKCPNLGCKMSLAPNSILIKSDNNDYLYYWLSTRFAQERIKKITSKSAMPKFNKTEFKKIFVPLPSLSEQQRIVSILDTFEASISNLEAQLAQRQKQYEYYRNQLLTFE